jgi:hypothetical protein
MLCGHCLKYHTATAFVHPLPSKWTVFFHFQDLSRHNYGAISLIPKVKGADNIKLFRPITLINVLFKVCAKAYATRLAPIAQRVISKSQTAFLKDRNILEGPIALLEIVHELKHTKGKGVLLKLDFEKAYDRVNWEFVGPPQKGF